MPALIMLVVVILLIALVCYALVWAVSKAGIKSPPANWITIAIVLIGVLFGVAYAWPILTRAAGG